MKYEQENLLEKFIQNAKRSRLWTILGVIAFSLISVSVVYVAKEIKGPAVASVHTDTIFSHDTVLVVQENQHQCDYLRDSIAREWETKYNQIVDSVKGTCPTCPPCPVISMPTNSDSTRYFYSLYIREKVRATRIDSLYQVCRRSKTPPTILRVPTSRTLIHTNGPN